MLTTHQPEPVSLNSRRLRTAERGGGRAARGPKGRSHNSRPLGSLGAVTVHPADRRQTWHDPNPWPGRSVTEEERCTGGPGTPGPPPRPAWCRVVPSGPVVIADSPWSQRPATMCDPGFVRAPCTADG